MSFTLDDLKGASFDIKLNGFNVRSGIYIIHGNNCRITDIERYEITNIREFGTQFTRVSFLTQDEKDLIARISEESHFTTGNHVKGESLAGKYFLQRDYANGSQIPAVFRMGRIAEAPKGGFQPNKRGHLYLPTENELEFSLFGPSSEVRESELFGWLNTREGSTLYSGGHIFPLSRNEFDGIAQMFENIEARLQPEGKIIPCPTTREFNRLSLDYQSLVKKLTEEGFVELDYGIFRFLGQEPNENTDTVVAVNPYSLQHYEEKGKHKTYSDEDVASLMQAYDNLFKEHDGPLVVFGEEDHVMPNLERIKGAGRQHDTYFVVTNEHSSVSSFTDDRETKSLLQRLNRPIKCVGGYFAGEKPYVRHIPLQGDQKNWGCLHGLMKRLENLGLESKPIPDLVYS